MRPKECPKCESIYIGDRWCKKRMLQYYCRNCSWADEPQIPELKPIPTTKTVSVNQFGGFIYELYDKYGHILIHSRSYDSEDKAEHYMMQDLNSFNKSEYLFPCTAILWPDKVTVQGKVFKTFR